MLIGCGTGVAVGMMVKVAVGSGVEICVGVSVAGMGVSVGKGAASTVAQPVSISENAMNTNKVFFIKISSPCKICFQPFNIENKKRQSITASLYIVCAGKCQDNVFIFLTNY
jgi:hypothetical protein